MREMTFFFAAKGRGGGFKIFSFFSPLFSFLFFSFLFFSFCSTLHSGGRAGGGGFIRPGKGPGGGGEGEGEGEGGRERKGTPPPPAGGVADRRLRLID